MVSLGVEGGGRFFAQSYGGWRGCLAHEMGSFFVTILYGMGINRCGYKIIEEHNMDSFGNFLLLTEGFLPPRHRGAEK